MQNSEPRVIYEVRNVDDVFTRNVIGGLLNILNNRIKYKQVWSESEVDELIVPFFYDMGISSERYIQDNFMFFDSLCQWPLGVDGSYDSYPRGVISYESSAIDAQNITNRFVMGQYVRKEGSKLQTYVSFLYSIPLTYNFNVTIESDTVINMFKIEQSLREFLYKNKKYYIIYKGQKIGCRAGFPESYSSDKKMEYKMGISDESKKRITFSISVETYQPVFDPTTEMKADNRITQFAYDVKLGNRNSGSGLNIGSRNSDGSYYSSINPSNNSGKSQGEIIPLSDYSGSILPSGAPVTFDWTFIKSDGDMRTVGLKYVDETSRESIITSNINYSYYIWNIPEDFSGFNSTISLTFINSDDAFVYRYPIVKVIPDPNTKLISEKSFVIIDPGYIPTNQEISTIQAEIDYKDSTGNIITLPNNTITFNLLNGKIDLDNPVKLHGPDIYYNNTVESKKIDLVLYDALDTDIKYIMTDITVV